MYPDVAHGFSRGQKGGGGSQPGRGKGGGWLRRAVRLLHNTGAGPSGSGEPPSGHPAGGVGEEG